MVYWACGQKVSSTNYNHMHITKVLVLKHGVAYSNDNVKATIKKEIFWKKSNIPRTKQHSSKMAVITMESTSSKKNIRSNHRSGYCQRYEKTWLLFNNWKQTLSALNLVNQFEIDWENNSLKLSEVFIYVNWKLRDDEAEFF